MSKASFKTPMSKTLNKYLGDYVYNTGVRKNKNNRKRVLHNKTSLVTTSRGLANAKSKKKDSEQNTDVINSLYRDYRFRFYSLAFFKSQNPNYNTFVKSVKYIFDDNPRRFENAITANVKAFLDKQTKKTNKHSTAKQKKFNKFGIDSRQMQLSLDTERLS